MSSVDEDHAQDTPVRHRWSESARFVPRVVVQPVQRFMDTSASGALVMLAAALAALLWVNLGSAQAYESFWGSEVRLAVGSFEPLHLNLREWVNDGAMAFFFFLVAMEIKREMVSGELRDPKAAALPVIAAVCGMVVPALIYLGFNAGGPGGSGWGIPMATDIAFAVAVVTAAGDRVPAGLRVFLLSLAVVDDLGAIIVIAVFYTAGLSLTWLLLALATIGFGYALQRIHVRALPPYFALAALCWYALHASGVHPTLAGVAFGLLTPAWSFLGPSAFRTYAGGLVREVDEVYRDEVLSHREYDVTRGAVRDMRRLTVDAEAPLDRLEQGISAWVTFLVVPVFALANAGLVLPDHALTAWVDSPVALGVVLGLVVGKTVGVFGATWVATRLGIATLPRGTTWPQVLGVAACAGVGFTVALFVSDLSFDSPALDEAAKLGIFLGSAIAGVLGFLLLRLAPRGARPDPAAEDPGTPAP
ncbi:Na+/H+ antiporter NhaA [Nocardioides mesophilus]|uniref:Na(+)/H(+) antiporter NhaA n=1 Tax=Nocardioides mesophilus TaxID=433659 RepID=A0A7G9RE73_9ACTN|nr:Na+/H+ antiporter NhaA [Nocardioides mesophilus]QNN53898.1 Na+/H+ antiporter NhaA [Nocardioides mesophilus]